MEFKSLQWNEAEASRVQSLDLSDLGREIVEARDSLMAVQRAGKTDDHDEASLSLKAAAESGEFGDGVTEAQLKDAALHKAKWVENAMKVQIARSDADRITRAAEARLNELPATFDGSLIGSKHAKFDRKDLLNFYFEQNGNEDEGHEQLEQMIADLKARRNGTYEMGFVPGKQIMNAAASQTTGKVSVYNDRDPRDVVILHQPKFSVAMNLPVETINTGNSLIFMREVIDSSDGTRAVTGVAETGAAPNQTIKSENVTVQVAKRAVSMGITEEQLMDVPQAASFINRKMNRFMAEDLENQVLNGTGTNQFKGFFDTAGRTGTDAVSTLGAIPAANSSDKNRYLEHCLNAFEKLYDEEGTRGYGKGNTMPSFLAVRWTELKNLMLSKTSEGEYLWGDAVSGDPDRIWGVPIIQAQFLPTNKALTLNAQDCFILYRQGLTMEWGISDDDFLRGQRRIRMVYRANLGIERPGSVVTIDFTQGT